MSKDSLKELRERIDKGSTCHRGLSRLDKNKIEARSRHVYDDLEKQSVWDVKNGKEKEEGYAHLPNLGANTIRDPDSINLKERGSHLSEKGKGG